MSIRPIEEMYRRGNIRRDGRGRLVIRVSTRTIRLPGSEVTCLGTLRDALTRRGLLRRKQIEVVCTPHERTERLLFGPKPTVGLAALV
ncbi:hypothetical protein HYW83_01750 [Candidatus Peregrinibacteria bacterium]|nr:hypothetical protein [Candidatus Peregrinibacteria bacterium]